MSENQAQIDYWNGDAGKTWVRNQEVMDGNLIALTELALTRANPKPGERVLDVGCGAGDTTLALGRAVSRDSAPGRVTGVDVSEPMLARARERLEAAGALKSAVSLLHADAAEHSFPQASFDLVFSRFGVMFFADPVRAFANLAKATAPTGRLTFMCWRRLEENPWMNVPLEAARPFLPKAPPPPDDAPGPFAFAREARVRSILEAAGYRDVGLAAMERPLRLGRTKEEAADFALQVGATARALRELGDASVTAKVRERLVALFSDHKGHGRIELGSAVWLVSARPPAS